MRHDGGSLRLAATDLSNHLACPHLTWLDADVAMGRRAAPPRSPDAEVLQIRGLRHEAAYLAHLEAGGLHIDGPPDEESAERGLERTRAAMRRGAPAIAQASLAEGRWHGRADLLLRVASASDLGDWSYEVLDTKLAHQTRAGTLLQLCLYAEGVAAIQGRMPEQVHVVTPSGGFTRESYRLDDYLAYYRQARRRLETAATAVAEGRPAPYPVPVPHCDICRWWRHCGQRRREDDHLSLVAGVSPPHTREWEAYGIDSTTALARLPLPLPGDFRPRRGAIDGYAAMREQARLQVESRGQAVPRHELLAVEPDRGLARLPEPSPGDLFLDLEGDPFVPPAGREYLFGFATADASLLPVYAHRWAVDVRGEREAFEWLVDAILERWAADPGMHVYHFGHYEPATLKRLMGRHATRENAIDRLLRGRRFVDLFQVVRQALRAGIERYSIKDLEPLFGFERAMDLGTAARHRRAVDHALELETPGTIGVEDRQVVTAYNQDDCVSTLRLRDWLESLRAARLLDGMEVPRPQPPSDAPSAAVEERDQRVQAMMDRLLAGVPEDPAVRDAGAMARWRLAHLLDWHRRENKAAWWEYYRLRELPAEDLVGEKQAIGGLAFHEDVPHPRRRVRRYRFPRQETSLREGAKVHAPGLDDVGEILAIDLVSGLVDLALASKALDWTPTGVFASEVYHAGAQADALLRLGGRAADGGLEAEAGEAALELLRARAPRFAHAARPSDFGADDARGAALALRDSVLAVQGPPGTGKTYTGARMILDLVAAGRKVGVCANSHKVIRNLLEETAAAARETGRVVAIGQKVRDEGEEDGDAGIVEFTDNAAPRRALETGEIAVLGGTAWLWAREDMEGSVDVLFVDEAGQMALANALAIAPAAPSLILLGDPQQLEQPVQGSHPDGVAVSALEHLLDGAATIPGRLGLFLDATWRMHPDLAAFTSERFYEGRLRARPELIRQSVSGPWITAPGQWFLPVEHEGNQSACAEEVEAIARLVSALTDGRTIWTDANGAARPLVLADLLLIAPYNAQVADLRAALPGARVGTVDRFQGQEAPVVIVSMTTSSAQDAPRGMDFLYHPNRFNVATSRARGACVVVASPRLFAPDCVSPEQMRLANHFCRYLEVARRLTDPLGAGAESGRLPDAPVTA